MADSELRGMVIPHLRSQFERGTPVLFTGAGFSLAARNILGTPIPTVTQLKEALWSICFPGQPRDGSTPLQDLYEFALIRQPKALTQILKQSFTVADAVERYSGMNSMATYQILNKDVSPSGTDFPSNPAVYKKYSIRLLKQQKDLYSAIGLPAVSKTIQQLRSITEHVPNYGDWSFNEICGIVGTTSLLAVKKLLQSTPPFDTPSLGSGFRALLNASG